MLCFIAPHQEFERARDALALLEQMHNRDKYALDADWSNECNNECIVIQHNGKQTFRATTTHGHVVFYKLRFLDKDTERCFIQTIFE